MKYEADIYWGKNVFDFPSKTGKSTTEEIKKEASKKSFYFTFLLVIISYY